MRAGGAERGIVIQEELAGQFGFAKAVSGFSETQGSEIEEGEEIEFFGRAHFRVKGADKVRGGIEFRKRERFVMAEILLRHAFFKNFGKADGSEESESKSGRKKWIDKSSSRRKESPIWSDR